jgi:hypothetical protein
VIWGTEGSAFDLPAKDEDFNLVMNNDTFDLIAFKEMDAILTEFK